MLMMFSLFFMSMYLIILYLFFFSFFNKNMLIEIFLFSYNNFDITISFVLDFLSLGFFSSVSFITFNVFLYSIFYLNGETNMRRFSWLVFVFVMSMFILVFSGNFFMVMIGWDGLGLVSFCLVIFYSNSSSLESGLVTVFSNRVGDVFFLISFVFFYFNKNNNWDFFSFSHFFLFTLLIFFGAITKSAQVPFSAWLPAAMAAPTPVSSLVHSSTLVTAGVYVLIRFNYLFSFLMYSFLKIIFLFTMFIAGICAFMENDLKKIVAMSTLSQLGMMMFIISIGNWILSFLHMIIHAFFKSMLFLSTGSLMMRLEGTQDSRFYMNSNMSLPSFIFFSTSCLCLSGFPFLIGFYSKDFIISSSSEFSGLMFYYVFISSCIFTILYSMRLIFEAYMKMCNYFMMMNYKESMFFSLPVSFLFFKCWLTGGLFYWLFLIDMNYFMSMFDLLNGMILMSMSIILINMLKFNYYIYFLLSMIWFLRWKKSSGSTFLNSYYLFNKFENTWMEFLGGMGIYSTIMYHNNKMNKFENIKLGFFMLLSLLMIFFFY